MLIILETILQLAILGLTCTYLYPVLEGWLGLNSFLTWYLTLTVSLVWQSLLIIGAFIVIASIVVFFSIDDDEEEL